MQQQVCNLHLGRRWFTYSAQDCNLHCVVVVVVVVVVVYIYIYEHEAIRIPKSENNIGASSAPQKFVGCQGP